MKFANILIALVTSVACMDPILIREEYHGQRPEDIVKLSKSGMGVIVTKDNIKQLMSVMKEACVDRAYVYGWGNAREGPMVLTVNGTLLTDRALCTAQYALCVNTPCRDDNIAFGSQPLSLYERNVYNHLPNSVSLRRTTLEGSSYVDCLTRPSYCQSHSMAGYRHYHHEERRRCRRCDQPARWGRVCECHRTFPDM